MYYLKQKKAYALILLLISPLLGLVYGLKNLDKKGQHLVLSLFGLFYGLLLNYSGGNDAASHANILSQYYTISFGEFFVNAISILTLDLNPDLPSDLYVHFLYGIAGGLFQSANVLFSIVGFIYGYFYGRAILKVVNISKIHSVSITLFMLILLFLIHRSFESMQTIRSWTGLWVFFNGVYSYHETKKKKYILLILITPLIHLMYAFIALPAIIIIIFPKIHQKLLIIIYLISFVASVNTVAIINTASESDLAKEKISSYYRISDSGEEIDPILERQGGSSSTWYAKYGKSTAVYLGASVLLFVLIFGGFYSKDKMSTIEYGITSTGIALASLANILSFAYAFYSRTMAVASIFILAATLLVYLNGSFKKGVANVWKRIGLWIGILIFIPKIFYFASDFLYKTSMFIIMFPLTNLFADDLNFSIRDTINIFLN